MKYGEEGIDPLMIMIAGHELTQDQNGELVVILYVKTERTEFAQEHMEPHNQQSETVDQAVHHYIRERLPHIRAKAAKVVLGSMIIASIPLLGGQAAGAATPTLAEGMEGHGVTYLQRHLDYLGYFDYHTATGTFGNYTEEAVRQFQREYGLTPTGVADPVTRTAIERAVIKKNMIRDAYNYTGVPYVWGGETPSGFDCSGFIHYMLQKHGIDSERTTSRELYKMGIPVGRQGLQVGDLVFFGLTEPGEVSHVGFYVGDGKFISATNSKGIWVYDLDNSYWGPKYLGARRIY
ncbi:C40 family peptidase [Brevibacillus dissolubilis]|uniref:C40 family peptidase n=1 Tax=Brevibacillus dissolubilis TaxID=1844116 RepID=UPI0011170DDD|nr:NlpC/P60 family protein [Brevibacillus dissolubilis]